MIPLFCGIFQKHCNIRLVFFQVVHVKDFVMKEGKPEFAHVGEGLFHYEPLMKNLKYDLRKDEMLY